MIKQSPIFYSGNKLSNIKNGLIKRFPKNINTFIDVFTGSGVVCLNTNASRILMNDLNTNVINLLNMFKNEDLIDLRNFYDTLFTDLNGVDTSNISFDKRSKNFNLNLYEKHKKYYNRLRELYNSTKDVRILYLLTIHSFCHQIRFNSNNEFNMPIGNGKFDLALYDRMMLFKKFLNNNCILCNKDFRELDYSNITENDFIYFDPPYLITLATYNENGGWKENDEIDLYNLLTELNSQGIKWGLSNVVEHKGKVNLILKDFMKDYRIYYENLPRASLGKGNANTVEVYVYNY